MQLQNAVDAFEAKWVAELGLMELSLPRKHPKDAHAEESGERRNSHLPSSNKHRKQAP